MHRRTVHQVRGGEAACDKRRNQLPQTHVSKVRPHTTVAVVQEPNCEAYLYANWLGPNQRRAECRVLPYILKEDSGTQQLW